MDFKKEDIKIDKRKLNRLKYNIFGLERENLKTKQYREYEMNKKIIEIIERVVLD